MYRQANVRFTEYIDCDTTSVTIQLDPGHDLFGTTDILPDDTAAKDSVTGKWMSSTVFRGLGGVTDYQSGLSVAIRAIDAALKRRLHESAKPEGKAHQEVKEEIKVSKAGAGTGSALA